jgi:sialate O-acetylesterase
MLIISRTERVAAPLYQQSPLTETLNHSDLFNAMIYPFTRMVIYGAIWYQGKMKCVTSCLLLSMRVLGEANSGYNTDKYACTFAKMIESWRDTWSTRSMGHTNVQFPFGFVQVSSYVTVSRHE